MIVHRRCRHPRIQSVYLYIFIDENIGWGFDVIFSVIEVEYNIKISWYMVAYKYTDTHVLFPSESRGIYQVPGLFNPRQACTRVYTFASCQEVFCWSNELNGLAKLEKVISLYIDKRQSLPLIYLFTFLSCFITLNIIYTI